MRPFDNAYLAIPEWYIVYAADEYARVLAGGMPSQFDYSRANQEYWKELDYVTALTASSTNNNDDYKTVLSVIGWSFSVENIIKGLYENTIGRISEWCAGHTQVPEDRYAAKVAQEYATLIYDLPWYDFTYADSLKGLWHVHADSELSVGQNIRRAERRIFLSLEYSIKAVYSSAIAYATHSKFGVQDDVIFAIVSEDGGKTEELLSAPHYQPFTRMLLDRMKSETASSSFRILEISGNDKITFAYLDDVGAAVVAPARMVARDTEVVAVSGSQVIYKDRITVLVNVGDLFTIYRTLAQRGIAIEHFYDY